MEATVVVEDDISIARLCTKATFDGSHDRNNESVEWYKAQDMRKDCLQWYDKLSVHLEGK